MGITFDSGFAVARLVRHSWFVQLLKNHQWASGDLILGATPDTSIEEIRRCLKFYDPGTTVWLVLCREWMWVTQRDTPSVMPLDRPIDVMRLVL